MKELSIFIDESGDFGVATHNPSYYLVTLVFHNQDTEIKNEVMRLDETLKLLDRQVDYIHTEPIIRREDVFHSLSIDERRKLLYCLLNFYNHCAIKHTTIVIDRKVAPDKIRLSGALAKKLAEVIDDNIAWLNKFDKIIVYYDNGQIELSSILNAVISLKMSNVEFRKAEPQRYKLLQVADFICSFELLRIKRSENRLSKSEQQFFYKPNELKKTFIKSLDRKKL